MPYSGASVSTNVYIGASTGPIQSTVVNGDFEKGDLTGWQLSGSGSAVTSFGAIAPFEGDYMAKISTGSGAVGGASSSLEQSFTVPTGATTLTVYYNFVSAEYPEWVGSAYNDVFNASLHTPSGSVEVAFESVNSADFHPAPGLSSWGETGWLVATVDVSQWAGLNDTLTFSVHDVGDTVVDTVVLVDGIQFDVIENDDHADCPCDDATQITANSSSVMGNIEVMYDQDWFMFEAEAGVHYTIETILGFGIPATADTYLVLSDGISTIASNDNSGLLSLSKIEWDCEYGGAYYIGVMGNQSSPSYTGNYQLSLTSKKIIYCGIHGGNTDDLPGNHTTPSKDYFITTGDPLFRGYINQNGQTVYKNFYGNNDADVDLLGNRGDGVDAVALKLSALTASGLFRISTPGAVLYNANIIDNNFKTNDQIFLAGHSAGGGDVQDISRRLNDLGTPIIFTAQIDSIERFLFPPADEFDDDDENIPSNVSYAINYYQTETAFVDGEDHIRADNSNTTTILGNINISSPIGPATPLDDDNNPHRNIDNDPRVWKGVSGNNYNGILGYITQYSFIEGQ